MPQTETRLPTLSAAEDNRVVQIQTDAIADGTVPTAIIWCRERRSPDWTISKLPARERSTIRALRPRWTDRRTD